MQSPPLQLHPLQPLLPAEPGLLPLRVLAGGEDDEFLAFGAGNLPGKKAADLARPRWLSPSFHGSLQAAATSSMAPSESICLVRLAMRAWRSARLADQPDTFAVPIRFAGFSPPSHRAVRKPFSRSEGRSPATGKRSAVVAVDLCGLHGIEFFQLREKILQRPGIHLRTHAASPFRQRRCTVGEEFQIQAGATDDDRRLSPCSGFPKSPERPFRGNRPASHFSPGSRTPKRWWGKSDISSSDGAALTVSMPRKI